MHTTWYVGIPLIYETRIEVLLFSPLVCTKFYSKQLSMYYYCRYPVAFLFCSCKRVEMHAYLDIISSHVLFRIRKAYPAFDLKTNTGKIWSVTTRYPDHILGESKFRISVWTDSSPYPLLLTQHGKWLRSPYHSTIQFHADDKKTHLLSGKILGEQALHESWVHALSKLFSIFAIKLKSH